MSEDISKKIDELLKNNKGDTDRLNQISDKIRNDHTISDEDRDYVDLLSKDNNTNILESDNIDTFSENHNIASKKPSLRKIVIAAIIAGIILTAYAGLDVYAANSLQFRPHHGEQVVLSDNKLGIKAEVCNPSYFPVTFSSYQITAYYNSDIIENAVMNGSKLSPKSGAILDGIFSINKDAVEKFGKSNAQFNSSQATIVTKVNAPIFGFIPYSIEKKFQAQEFQNMIKNPTPGSFNCV